MYKKIILLIIIFFTFSVSFASDNVKIGLEYNKEINEAIITSSQNFYVNINDDKLIDLDKNILKIYKNNEFYLKINQKFDRLEDALIILDSLNKKGQTCFLFYDNSWEIYTGNYNSIDEAKAHNNNNFDIVLPNSKNIIVKNSDNKIIFSYNSESDISFTSGEIIEFGSKYFRGSFMFKRCKESDFTIINKLPIEEYLYGVISKEMPANWPIEALKAQAIAARNFTVSNLGKYSDLGFDLTDDINSQVYGGYDAESEKIKLAVDETFNMLLRSNSNNNIVSAYYHSNSGGQTESIENVWQTQVPYLVGVKDEYSENVQNSNWSKKYTLHEISNKLNEAGYDVGEIYDVEMASVSQNYRILEIIFKGSKNNII
ncbi:MAG: SpoIID/LytB domain-containing protein, partial [Bacillota bacterium]|nr:SpoIID/LytB domain-containing protein [Bacillota bacterium]